MSYKLDRVATLVAIMLAALCQLTRADAASPSVASQNGGEILARIQASFYIPDRGLFAEEIGTGKPLKPSWVWDASMELGALCAAARLEPKTYLPQVTSYASAIRQYRTTNHDRPGLDVNPPPKNPDRYYDDNAWICLALLEAHDLTHDAKDLQLAQEAYRFALSGEDTTTLGGGIYWHEDRPNSKNACSSGPLMLASMALYKLTGEQAYLDTAKRLYVWTCAHLQDTDGLVFDSIRVPSGNIGRAKFTYNSATLIRINCELYRTTKEQHYLDEAHRIAQAAEKRFVREEDGIISGAGKLGVKLIEAFLELYDTDHDEHWRTVVGRCLNSLHEHHRNAAGWYPPNWQSDPPAADASVRLIDQAAPARAFWIAAEHGVELK